MNSVSLAESRPRALSTVALLAVAASVSANAQTAPVDAKATAAVDATLPISSLKVDYMACDSAASIRMLSFGDAARCSIIAEALLKRGFNGDVDALLGWWRAERHAAAAPVRKDALASTLR